MRIFCPPIFAGTCSLYGLSIFVYLSDSISYHTQVDRNNFGYAWPGGVSVKKNRLNQMLISRHRNLGHEMSI